jgi:polyisoprenoid-binding protein YceI
MNKQFLVMAVAVIALTACNNAPDADKAATTEQQTVTPPNPEGANFAADLTASTVGFIGTKPTGQHSGVFSLKEGSVTVKEGAITAGNFVVDVASFKVTDADTAGASKLKGHLSSGDFFDVAKFPTASFEVTKVEVYDSTKIKSILPNATHIISGNLKLKDSTKNISFPANVAISETNVTATADFNIDRSLWGLSYGNNKSLGDKFIRPEVNIKLNFVANK